MAGRLSIRWTGNRVLAAIALGLGVLALAGNPIRGHTVRIDTQELATMVSGEVDHVRPADLADWIIRGASDYRLVDIRTPEQFAAYHIPTAENVPLAGLPDHGLGRNEKIVLYSEGGIHSAQAWMLLRAQGYTGVYILLGGLEGWSDEVLHPVMPTAPAPREAALFERTAQVARFFGGGPRAAVPAGADSLAAGAAAPAVPQMALPRAPVAPAGRGPAAGKKRKEGC